ncbi:MAG: MBOAT family protein, partial [Candidatus Electrothrix sp. AW3_4]|nr:MBOAT family protein [Candidatus Electrothrix gigas]
MIFHSPLFLFIFLPLTVSFFYQLKKYFNRNAALGWLVFTSLLFYSYWQPAYLVLLLASILFNYLTGSILTSAPPERKKIFLFIGIGVNITLLSYYKYSSFILKNISLLFDSSINFHPPLLPVAISFFTFQQIIYLVDIYKGDTGQPSLLNYLLFISFFPQLTAGPIVYPKEMLPQFNESDLDFRYSHIALGGTLIIFGLFKKIVLADNLAYYVSPVFQSAESGNSIPFFYAWQGALAYTFQIYFDFSGYSDMAVGIARLFGISLPINFNSPYKAASIIEFWRRWHITLSRFLRVYLYFPLGGNRKGTKRKHFNLILTMLLGGLWHGAGWTFVIWGGLHGIYLMINHGWRKFRL